MATSDPQRVTAPGLTAFRAEAQPVVDGTGEVIVEGEVDVATAPQLREALHQAIDDGATRVRIDLAEVGFIDSAGLGVLIGVLKRVREVGGEIELAHVQPAPRKVIEITGLDELFSLSD
jgi:anti-sigma B factor antagonist